MRFTAIAALFSLFYVSHVVAVKRVKAYEKYQTKISQKEWDSDIQPFLQELIKEYKFTQKTLKNVDAPKPPTTIFGKLKLTKRAPKKSATMEAGLLSNRRIKIEDRPAQKAKRTPKSAAAKKREAATRQPQKNKKVVGKKIVPLKYVQAAPIVRELPLEDEVVGKGTQPLTPIRTIDARDIDLIGLRGKSGDDVIAKNLAEKSKEEAVLSAEDVDKLIGEAILPKATTSATNNKKTHKPRGVVRTVEYALARKVHEGAKIQEAVTVQRKTVLQKTTVVGKPTVTPVRTSSKTSTVDSQKPIEAYGPSSPEPLVTRIDAPLRPLGSSIHNGPVNTVTPSTVLLNGVSTEDDHLSNQNITPLENSNFDFMDSATGAVFHPKKNGQMEEINFRARRHEKKTKDVKHILVPAEIPISEVELDAAALAKGQIVVSSPRGSPLSSIVPPPPPPDSGISPAGGFPTVFHPTGYFIVPVTGKSKTA